MFDVFGAEMPLAVRFFLAFLIVLGLIGVTAWAVRRFGSGRLSSTARGRQPRLAVIDYASVDARRRLILVRRDNVEHLLMIGGPTDVVVEPNIVRATPAARDTPLARQPAVVTDTLPRVIPLPETAANESWPLQPEPVGPPPGPRRAPRLEPVPDEPRSASPQPPPPPPPSKPLLPESPQRPQREALAALAEDLAATPGPQIPPLPPRPRPAAGPARPQPIEARTEPRSEPRPEVRVPTVSPEPEAPSAVDQNLAEMAQRLEAALRKPKPAEAREPHIATPAAAVSPPAATPEESAEAPPPPAPTPPPIPRVARPAEPRPSRPAVAKPREGKAIYDTLEQEMASLLGRPPGKTN